MIRSDRLLNLRHTQPLPVASRLSRFSIAGFHVPTMPDIVEDMGRPLNFGWQDHKENAENEICTEPRAGPSRIPDGGLPLNSLPVQERVIHGSDNGEQVRFVAV